MAHVRQHAALAPDVVLQVIGEDALLLKLDQEVVFSLNATGARIASLMTDHSEIGALIEALAREYGTPAAVITVDVLALLDTLVARSLVILTEPEGPAT